MPARQRAEATVTARPKYRTGACRLTVVSGIVLILDQLTKLAVQRSFTPGDSIPLLSPVLSLTYVQNTGAAFGLFRGQQTLFIVLAVAIGGWIVREVLAGPPPGAAAAWALPLILGGSLGNLMDRLRFGHVVDFIDVHVWPVFNVADSAITVGVALLLWGALRPRQD